MIVEQLPYPNAVASKSRMDLIVEQLPYPNAVASKSHMDSIAEQLSYPNAVASKSNQVSKAKTARVTWIRELNSCPIQTLWPKNMSLNLSKS